MHSRTDILGVGVSSVTLASAGEEIAGWIARGERQYVCVTGVHGVIESLRDAALRRVHNAAGMVAPDGMPLVAASRLLGARGIARTYGPDLMLSLCALSVERGWRHYFYGSTPEIVNRLTARLVERFPGLRVTGSCSPPFRALTGEESRQAAEAINAARPDIVWVGLSTPKQERWMARHRPLLEAPVLMGVGAAFDFHAGNKRQAPLWMRGAGLEWLFRLCSEPRRLWRRYLTIVPAFLLLFGLQVLGVRPAKREV